MCMCSAIFHISCKRNYFWYFMHLVLNVLFSSACNTSEMILWPGYMIIWVQIYFVHVRTFLVKVVLTKINVRSLTRFMSLGSSSLTSLRGPPHSPKNENKSFRKFKSSRTELFVHIDQVFVANRVKFNKLKNEKRRAIRT